MVVLCNNARKKLRASSTLGRDAGNTTRRSAMARLLVAILAAATTSVATALKTPQKSRALKVRGGSTVQKVGTALIGLEGVVGMIAPEAACKNYGHTPTPDDVQFKRYTSTWLAGLAVLLCLDADAYGWHCATNIFLLAAAVLTVSICVEIKILRRVRAESSRRPPRHRRDACSMAWRCRFLTCLLYTSPSPRDGLLSRMPSSA